MLEREEHMLMRICEKRTYKQWNSRGIDALLRQSHTYTEQH